MLKINNPRFRFLLRLSVAAIVAAAVGFINGYWLDGRIPIAFGVVVGALAGIALEIGGDRPSGR